MDAATPATIVAARGSRPLIVGRAEGVTYLASDIPAILERTRELVAIEDDQVAVLTPGGLVVRNLEGDEVQPTPLSVDWDVETAELGGHPDFMTKEIYEQPDAVRATLLARHDAEGRIVLDELRLSDEELAGIERVVLVGCGTSYHAAMVGRSTRSSGGRGSAATSTSRASSATATRCSTRAPWSSGSPSPARRSTPSRRSAPRARAARGSWRCPTSSTPRWRARPTRSSTRARGSRSASRRPRRCSPRSSRSRSSR